LGSKLRCSGFGWGRKELDDAALNGKRDPSINELAEAFVDAQAFLQPRLGSGADKATDWFAAIDVGEFVVRAMSLGMLRVHAAAPGAATELVLA
jgi:hypothetical protein